MMCSTTRGGRTAPRKEQEDDPSGKELGIGLEDGRAGYEADLLFVGWVRRSWADGINSQRLDG